MQVNNELEDRVKARTGALAASEHQLRTITDAIPGLITYIDRDERYRFINKTYEEWFGVSRSKVMGKKLKEVLAFILGGEKGAEAYGQIKEYIKRALQGERLQYATTLVTKGGQPKHVLVNERYCQLVGRSKEELYQIRMQDISHEGDLPQNMSLFQKAIKSGTPFTIEKRYSRADGSEVWVRNNVSVVKDHHNQAFSVVAVSQDITERKKAEQALQESKDLFQSFADTIQSLAWMTNPTGQVLWYNQRWYDYTGTTFAEIQNQGWLKVFHPDHIDSVFDHVQKAAEKGDKKCLSGLWNYKVAINV